MTRRELSDTLTTVVRSLEAPEDSGLVVTEAEVDMPLEVYSGLADDGRLVFYAQPPHSRYVSGVMPQVHRAHLHLVHAEPVSETAPNTTTTAPNQRKPK